MNDELRRKIANLSAFVASIPACPGRYLAHRNGAWESSRNYRPTTGDVYYVTRSRWWRI